MHLSYTTVNNISADGCKAIAEALRVNATLSTLDLGGECARMCGWDGVGVR